MYDKPRKAYYLQKEKSYGEFIMSLSNGLSLPENGQWEERIALNIVVFGCSSIIRN